QAERAEALGHHVGLHVTVVVLARPDDAAVALEDLGDHVVDQPVIVGDPGRLELRLELRLVYLGEQVLEPPVVGLEDRVLGGQVQRVAAAGRVAHGGPGEIPDRVVVVVHPHGHAAAGEPADLKLEAVRAGALVRLIGDQYPARAGNQEVGGAVLVAVRVPADDDRLGPAGHEAGNVVDHDRLAEHHAAEDAADGPGERGPNTPQPELAAARLLPGHRGPLAA